MTLGGAAQVAAAHCPNERTLDPAVCSYNRPTYAPASRTMYGLRTAMFSGNDSLFSVGSITRHCYSFTYPRGMEGWVDLSTTSVNNLLKVITRKRSWWDSNPRFPESLYSSRSYHCTTEPQLTTITTSYGTLSHKRLNLSHIMKSGWKFVTDEIYEMHICGTINSEIVCIILF